MHRENRDNYFTLNDLSCVLCDLRGKTYFRLMRMPRISTAILYASRFNCKSNDNIRWHDLADLQLEHDHIDYVERN